MTNNISGNNFKYPLSFQGKTNPKNNEENKAQECDCTKCEKASDTDIDKQPGAIYGKAAIKRSGDTVVKPYEYNPQDTENDLAELDLYTKLGKTIFESPLIQAIKEEGGYTDEEMADLVANVVLETRL